MKTMATAQRQKLFVQKLLGERSATRFKRLLKMGVKYLWSVLEPTCKEKPVSELFGKRVAVDTSCWVVSDNHILPSHVAKPHLRNLFFRTASLLKSGIEPVYVLEGKAPELKAQTMQKRRELSALSQAKGIVENTAAATKKNTDTSRSCYNYIQKECKELLDALGVTTIISFGEAEAGCATLNQLDLVDGCVTVDGDVFLYGAKKVFRNLSADLSNFVCQEFLMNKIESSLNLTRDKLIAMAIIFGCDYLPDGLCSMNKECIVKLLASWPNGRAVDVLKEWMETEITDNEPPARPAHCSVCKHPGSLRTHSKSGCIHCDTASGCKNANKPCECVWHKNELRYEEYYLRAKLRASGDSNILEIFEEFQKEPPNDWKNLVIPPWRMPSISKFVEISTKKLKWELTYATSKVLPLLTRWIAIHGHQYLEKGELDLFPSRIIKKRVNRGCPMYEVEWKFKQQMPGFPEVYVSLEPQFLIEQNHPALIPKAPPKPLKTKAVRKKRIVKADNVDANVRSNDIVEMIARMAICKQKEKTPDVVEADESLSTHASEVDDENLSDLSDIVDLICNRQRKPVLAKEQSNTIQKWHSPVDLPVESDDSIGVRFKEKHQTLVDKEMRANFSLNFTLSDLLKNRESFGPVECNEAQSSMSTPSKSLKDMSDHSDLFCTPKPLGERWNYNT